MMPNALTLSPPLVVRLIYKIENKKSSVVRARAIKPFADALSV